MSGERPCRIADLARDVGTIEVHNRIRHLALKGSWLAAARVAAELLCAGLPAPTLERLRLKPGGDGSAEGSEPAPQRRSQPLPDLHAPSDSNGQRRVCVEFADHPPTRYYQADPVTAQAISVAFALLADPVVWIDDNAHAGLRPFPCARLFQ